MARVGLRGAASTGRLLDEPLHRGLLQLVRDLNHTYAGEPALYEQDFELSGFSGSIAAITRTASSRFSVPGADADHPVVAVVNWTPLVRERYRIGVPHPGYWREVINTDLPRYGGSGATLGGGLDSEPIAAHGFAQSISLKLPPLGAVLLKRSSAERGRARGAPAQPTAQPRRTVTPTHPSRPCDERSPKVTNRRCGWDETDAGRDGDRFPGSGRL